MDTFARILFNVHSGAVAKALFEKHLAPSGALLRQLARNLHQDPTMRPYSVQSLREAAVVALNDMLPSSADAHTSIAMRVVLYVGTHRQKGADDVVDFNALVSNPKKFIQDGWKPLEPFQKLTTVNELEALLEESDLRNYAFLVASSAAHVVLGKLALPLQARVDVALNLWHIVVERHELTVRVIDSSIVPIVYRPPLALIKDALLPLIQDVLAKYNVKNSAAVTPKDIVRSLPIGVPHARPP